MNALFIGLAVFAAAVIGWAIWVSWGYSAQDSSREKF